MQTNQNPLTPREIELGYLFWLRHYEFTEADEAIQKFLSVEESTETEKPNKTRSQLKIARKARIHTISAAAAKFGCTKASWADLERSECQGSISLNSIRAAAAAIDCELVYFLRPKRGVLFSRAVFEDLLPYVRDQKALTRGLASMKPHGLASLLNQLMNDVKFRRKIGWVKKPTKS